MGDGAFPCSALVDGDELVGCLDCKGVLEFALPGRIGSEGVPLVCWRTAYRRMSSLATSLTAFARAFCLRPVGAAHLGGRRAQWIPCTWRSGRARRWATVRAGHAGGRTDDQVVARGRPVPTPDRARPAR